MDEIEELRRQLREEQRLREDNRRQLQEEQRLREDDQRRLREAEELIVASRPHTLDQYLEACHSLQLAVEALTKKSKTTQGGPTDPTGRIYPKRIVPWDDFDARQQQIWALISSSDSFANGADLPSPHQMEYVRSLLRPISSEQSLRDVERDLVENAVQKLIEGAYKDPLLRQTFGLSGPIQFESHTNVGDDTSLSEPMEDLSLDSGPVTPRPRPQPRVRRAARGKGNRADQFCIYKTSSGNLVPGLAVEYKPPHKLSVDEILTGLEMEIQPDRDVIHQDDFLSRRLAASVITQLFSYMIGKGIQYGYVCTGQAFVFLHIANDPATVYYSISVPAQDVADDDDNGTRLHGTAVGQVLAFVLQALRDDPPPEAWHDNAEELKLWPDEFDDILSRIPVTETKGKEPRVTPFKIPPVKSFTRSPIRTRARCKQMGPGDAVQPSDRDDGPSSSNLEPPRASGGNAVVPSAAGGSETSGAKQQEQGDKQQQEQKKQQRQKQRMQKLQKLKQQQPQLLLLNAPQPPRPSIETRPFCTQTCLLGLVLGRPVDEKCPNVQDHGPAHITLLQFLQLVRQQLATDRGRDADCTPLYLSGSRGSLFKVRLSSHGYTLVAKGVEGLDLACLEHEQEIYGRLAPLQGKHVPVCLGTIDLVRPYYYDCGVYVHFMFLSWGGQPLRRHLQELVKTDIDAAVGAIFKSLHQRRVLHRDAEPRNLVYNADNDRLMVIDFERSEYLGRQPLGSVVANVQGLKRKRAGLEKPKQQKDEFSRELASAVRTTSIYVAQLSRQHERGLLAR